MSEIKQKAQGINPYIVPRDLNKVAKLKDGRVNIYETLYIIAQRANQIGSELKSELHNKLNEFASSTDSLEEVHENKEQIEISKFYEKMPKPTIVATDEFLEGKLYFRRNEEEETA